METIHLIQDALSDSKSIFERIKSELLQAKQEVLVAMAWFTDEELFAILRDLRAQQVEISLIISDQVDNERLDFRKLKDEGAKVVVVKNVGWGMMNQKFCVIDRKIAIVGSYNWTVNAKTNNHETVVVTNFPKTVNELVNTFAGIAERAERLNNGEKLEDIIKSSTIRTEITHETQTILMQTQHRGNSRSFYEQLLKEYSDFLDHTIAAEIGAFDRELLKASGFNRAKENNGDHQILPQAMDSLYSNFINEIEVVEEKKSRLLARIDEQRKMSVANVELKTENEVSNFKENAILESKNTNDEMLRLTAEIETKQHVIKSAQETKIPFLSEKIALLKDKIKQLQVAFVKPPVNWPATSLLCFITVLLAFYIFVFYSSVAYIFIFSKEDIKTMELLGAANTEVPEVFNPHAISKIWEKGSGGILFLFLFVAIPLALGMFKVFYKSVATEDEEKREEKFSRGRVDSILMKNLGMILIMIVDAFIAYKVAVNINEIEFNSGDVEERIAFFDVLLNSNFWLVFALGGLGVFLFSFFFERLFKLLNDRTPTHYQEKVKQEVAVLESTIEEHGQAINALKLICDAAESDIANLVQSKEALIQQARQSPIQLNDKINSLQQQLLSYKERIGNIGNIYRSHIENDKLPISKTEMENRVNIYLEGWSKFLYQDYAVLRAEVKTKEAIHECETWLKQLSMMDDLRSTIADNMITLHN